MTSAANKPLFASIAIARRNRGLDEDTYRDLLTRETGKSSLREMTTPELELVLGSLGGRQTYQGAGRKQLTGPYAKKLQALWLSGWNLGVVRNKDDEAMLAFIKRQTGIENTRFLRAAEDARKAVEALKAWLARDAGVNWTSAGKYVPAHYDDDRYRIVCAQLRILSASDRASEAARCLSSVVQFAEYESADWIEAMNRLGVLIRQLRTEVQK